MYLYRDYFYWYGRYYQVADTDLRSVIHEELTNSSPRGSYPPYIPPLPEHRFSYGSFSPDIEYCRPDMTTSAATAELAQAMLGLRAPAIVLLQRFRVRERFIVTQLLPTWQRGAIALLFNGYRLHTNGRISDPVAGWDLCDSSVVQRRNLDGTWSTVMPLTPEVPR